MKCAVLHCTNSTYNNPDGVSFHGFPTDVEVLHVWVAATGRSDFIPNLSSKICGTHFDDDAYLTPKVLKKLKPNAVPTIFSRTVGVNRILGNIDPVQAKKFKDKERVSNLNESQDINDSPLACILNSNTAICKVQLVQECTSETETVSEFSPSPSVVSKHNEVVNFGSSRSFNQSHSSENNDTVGLNFRQNTPSTGSSSSVLSKYVSVKVVQMQNLQVGSQGYHLGHLMPPPLTDHVRNPPVKQFKCLESNIQSSVSNLNNSSKSGIVKVVDMKKLLQSPPAENSTNKSVKSQKGHKCNNQKLSVRYTEKLTSKPHEKLKNLMSPHNKSSEILTHASKRNILKSSSKVTVSHVFDCLRVILPGKFDLARLIPNEKVAALVIRYLKLVDNETSQNVVKTNLKIIIDAKKAQEYQYNNDVKHPYLKITDENLQEALAKVLPPNFSMIDVSNEILKCLCIILNLNVFTDGYHILRRKIRKFTCEGQKFLEIINQSTERITLQNKSLTVAKEEKLNKSKLKISNQPNTNRFKISNKSNEVNSSLSFIPHKKCSEKKLKNVFVDTKVTDEEDDCMEYSDNDVDEVKIKDEDWYEGEKRKKTLSRKLLSAKKIKKDKPNISKTSNQIQDNRFNNKGKSNKVNSSDSSIVKQTKPENTPKDSLYNTNVTYENDSSSKEDSTDSEYVMDSEISSDDEDWYESVKRKKELLNKPSVNLIEIVRYLEVKQCSAKDILVNFRLMFYLCRFLHIKSQHTNLQKLKAALHWIMKRDVNRSNVKYEDNLFQNKATAPDHKNVINEYNLSQHKVSPKGTKNCNDKLKLKPIVILHNIAEYRKDDMLFMRKQKINGYYKQRVPFCFQQNTSVQKFSSDYVRKLTNERYKVFRRIIMKRDGNKIVFRLKYEKLVPNSEVFVKDFRNPYLGWMRGTINQLNGPLQYMVMMTNGGTCWCGPEQLRPLSDKVINHLKDNMNTRVPRLVKPKQLFDL